MKKFISLALALVMALSLTTMAWGESYAYDGSNNGEACVVLNTTNGVTYDGATATANLTAGTGEYDAGVAMTGSGDFVIKNVNIATTKRGIEGNDIAGNVTIDNVVVTGAARALHLYTTSAANLTVTNSVFEGKVSFYLAGGSATFTNCTFKSSGVYDDVVEPWSNVTFVDCVFEGNVKVSFEDVTSGAVDVTAIEVDECYYEDGQPVTAASLYSKYTSADHASLVTLDPAPAVAEVDGKQYVSVDYAIAAANGAPVILLDTSATIPAGYSYSSLTRELYRAAENHYSTTNPSVSGTTSTGKNTYKLYSADGKTEHAIVGDVTFTSAAGQTVTNGVVTAGTVDYYTVNTTKLVVTDAACAEYRLVKNGSVIFVAPMNNTYSATVKPYELVATGCAKEALKNASDIVYVKTNLTATELPTYYVESKDGTVQGLLANGSIVKMVAVTKADVVTAGTHTWDKTTVVYNASTGVVTSVTCKACGAKAICAKVLPVGYELKQITMDAAVVATPANYVWYVDGVVTNTPTVVTPSTDKTVTSAQTFDAGIAMYVGMSVMAAAGSAVVIGKKKD